MSPTLYSILKASAGARQHITRGVVTFRYIGSKARVAERLAEHIGPPSGGFFVDLFCGTGAVAIVAADLGWPVRLNDHLHSASIMAAARLIAEPDAQFRQLGGYEAAVTLLNTVAPVQGFIWREYSPASVLRVGVERRYFTQRNAAKIDGIRRRISEWRTAGTIELVEERLLLADLLSAVNRIANIAGTYGCFLSKWTPQAHEDLMVKARGLRVVRVQHEVYVGDASRVPTTNHDLVYLDPPYTKRQYASYYHILETVALGDEPQVEGVSGLRPWRDRASEFCYKSKALGALTTLIDTIKARRILLSYSNEGHILLADLKDALAKLGSTELFELQRISRYMPNQAASAAHRSVTEFLLALDRSMANMSSDGSEIIQ